MGLHKFTTKEEVMQSFFFVMAVDNTITRGGVKMLPTQKIPRVKLIIEL
jgi:hypothetical protein